MSGMSSTINARSIHPTKVVVVEDDPSIAVLIAATLADEGYSPFVVRDGRKAIQVVRDLQPDVVTLDLHLSGIDGHAVLRRLVDVEHRPAVVVVSASTDELTRDERRLIARALPKPFELSDLVQAVEDVVGWRAS